MNYLKLNGDLMMKKLFYMVITYLLFASELSYANSKKIPDFSGEWGGRYEGCEFNASSWFEFKQKDSVVIGKWESLSTKSWSGKLKGKIIGDKLFVYYCSDYAEDKYYTVCPVYEKKPSDYFIKKKGRLVRYRNFGNKYRKDFMSDYIYKLKKGWQLPITKEKNCN